MVCSLGGIGRNSKQLAYLITNYYKANIIEKLLFNEFGKKSVKFSRIAFSMQLTAICYYRMYVFQYMILTFTI